MRVLNTSTFQLEYFIRYPPDHYAILSHTWDVEEITFDDIHKPHAKSMAGYSKVERCCQQALQDGFQYVWIDTCCIDKRSSAELSEAINSMYEWYWNAEKCYTYLADVTDEDVETIWQGEFPRSRWFTRGWTLQELLAPAVVEFYNSDWQSLGTKSTHLELVADITGIDISVLAYRENIKKACIAQKFSWASTRVTTREEDIAYCLLGLVGVNMPLLYGEGRKAFLRLQLEIIRTTNDHTLFVW
ncbi:HET-domain-containing protein, partial [Delitschia confertaspora ATCC 74209]